MNINSAKDLGALVRSERKRRGWTQKDLASQACVRPLWISQFERGKTTAQVGLVIRTLKALDLVLSVGDGPRESGSKGTVIDLDALVQPATSRAADVIKIYNP